ncbi:HAD domain-containing protein [Glaciimonas sp. Gout2]|uniref:HAD domain-containing protein n=1 Tax=unclassified Glaciimonas TaxID=2644401 RepID=UPI002AB480AB|nr:MULTISPECIES: HAD domain-containing protein [unclassified Glaciimonas]MDY7548576.1 HAD domain-containing protein [Glaciimonas sp. CA11.2]MEB0013763.1 HAD domain-containing protein [Glaciimonas sp. Cout2]MEB0083368.1 HAD domain-containing protein [Glaciimonas sp. Gout2]
MKILYLDFNGVLHDGMVMRNRKRGMYITNPERSFFEWMPILEELLAPHPDVKIVLSTSWVRALGFDATRQELSEELRARVLGSTFHHPKLLQSEFDIMPRGMQIWNDVEQRKPDSWFAIDDDAFGWPAWCLDRLVETKSHLGLSDPVAQEAVRHILAAL